MLNAGIMTVEEFEDILSNKEICVCDFSASWCGPCRMMEPVLEDFSKEHNVLKVDIDQFQELSNDFGIMSVPSLLLFDNGKFKKMAVGYHTIDQLKELIK